MCAADPRPGRRPLSRWSCALAVVAVVVPVGCSDEEEPALPDVPGSMQIEVTGAFARAAGDDLEVFFSMSNYGASDRLIGVDASVGDGARLWSDGVCSNDSTTADPTGHIEVPASSVVVLRPGGCRVVLEQGAAAAGSASTVEMTLSFAGSLVMVTPVAIKQG